MSVAAVVLIAAATVLFILLPKESGRLILSDADTGKRIASYSLSEGGEFAIEFKHSVNLSPVHDIYKIIDGKIINTDCIYYAFGAGVETTLEGTETLTYGEDGSMIISGINKEMYDMIYIVGTIYDHILFINDEKIILNDICGRNRHVRFQYRKNFWR